MKRFFFFLLLITTSLSVFSKGYRITYKIYVNGTKNPYIETTILCDNYLKISIDKNRFYLFLHNKGYIINLKKKTAIEYSFSKNIPFFSAFVSFYGISTNDGSIVFPQLIFKKTRKIGRINKIPCRKYELPGNYLNSKSVAWFAEKKLRYNGELFSRYLSFFTTSKLLLDQAKKLNSFPLEIETTINNGIVSTTNVRVLDKIEEISCNKKGIEFLKNLKITKAKPSGLPAKDM